MIRFLSIENVAVVDRLEIELSPGLSVLTGETGAGKSIVVGALELLAGGRASGDLVRTGAERARVQAMLDDGAAGEVLLRRDITAQGRSRAFVDGELTAVRTLHNRVRDLIDLHGQHEHQTLLDPGSHLALLDAFIARTSDGDDSLRVAAAFRAWQTTKRCLRNVRDREREVDQRRDLLAYQRDEIRGVSPREGEDGLLATRRKRLMNAERLATLATQAYGMLYEQDGSLMSGLGQVWRHLEELARLDESVGSHLGVRSEVESRLEDLAFFLRSYGDSIEASPVELEQTETRLNDLSRLKRKYGPSLDDVLSHARAIDRELATLEANEERHEALARRESEERQTFLRHAGALSEKRRAAADVLASGLQDVLADVGLPRARFDILFAEIPLDDTAAWTERGVDRVSFSFSANPGEAPRALARVASGGELSRVMLGIKTLATTDTPGKTLVFDEIDAGIGGAAADRVGSMLARLAERYQVICVTHLPQIAAYATRHYRVTKQVQRERTTVRVEELSDAGRVAELSRLMTGGETQTARAGAKELLTGKQTATRERRKRKAKARG